MSIVEELSQPTPRERRREADSARGLLIAIGILTIALLVATLTGIGAGALR